MTISEFGMALSQGCGMRPGPPVRPTGAVFLWRYYAGGPELESKKCVESAVLKLDDAAVHVATEHHSADDSHRARIILGNGTNDTHSVALLESLHQPLLHAFWFAEKYCGSAATPAGR